VFILFRPYKSDARLARYSKAAKTFCFHGGVVVV